ncbi:carboxypeptidase-like regulatory domain-containing protein [Schlesneria paludicola]|uniref:carboxypeptidase-like regulatory domain-containing protein n=1 Tax=Schlesneria paludicola TaxID=360056 RepID=UPI00029B3314|nr:carboxypeptidase-like regulatory domain-containing protein [Schlesneria paludicola]
MQNTRHVWWCGLMMLGSVVFMGCSSNGDKWTKDRPKLFKSSGVVKYKSEPVEGAIVLYQSGEQTARGLTDAAGRFVLTTFDEGDGAIAGTHKVSIRKTVYEKKPTKYDSPEERSVAKFPKEMLPAKYAKADSSGLTAEIKSGGKNQETFELDD